MTPEQAAARAEAAERDVARLDWLGDPMGASYIDWEHFAMNTANPKELREAIDAARERDTKP